MWAWPCVDAVTCGHESVWSCEGVIWKTGGTLESDSLAVRKQTSHKHDALLPERKRVGVLQDMQST